MTCVKEKGKANATRPSDITRLFNFLKIGSNAIFCDLGCGNGELCIKSISRVKEAIGFECDHKRYIIARKKTENYDSITIYKRNYEHKKTLDKFRRVTVFFCVNGIDLRFLKELESKVKKGSYFIQYFIPPCPIKPQLKLGWYYIMRTPFKYAKNKDEWVSSLSGEKKWTLTELKKRIRSYFSEDHKFKINGLNDDIEENFPGSV